MSDSHIHQLTLATTDCQSASLVTAILDIGYLDAILVQHKELIRRRWMAHQVEEKFVDYF